MPPATALAKRTCSRCGKTYDSDAAFCPSDGTKLEGPIDPDVDPYIGATLPGDIEIKNIAGSGAMGKVYRAHQRGIDRDVAVKILHRELSGNLPLVQRFHREAKIASKLQHPHVVEVYLAGQLPDGALYIVMEYLDGHSLAAALQSAGGRLDMTRALSIALQICDAVGEGHARGIVHRDLKPENVMLVRRADTSDFVKVLDFGIAKVSLGEQSMETAAGLIFGTARYISPEGAQGSTVGPAGDVYSIAVMLYQLLCGRTPFDAEQPVGLLIKHIHESPPLLRSWPAAKDVPEPIARVIMDNLVKDPTRRAPSARAFGNAIAAAAKEANVSFSDVGVVARMSMVDPGSAKLSVDRTLDDASMMPIPPSPGSAPTITSDEPPPPPPAKSDARSVPAPRPEKSKASAILVVVLAFLLGAAVAALVVQQLGLRKDEAHDAHIARTRRALVEGRYTAPPNDNVRDLVASGLKQWPDDPALVQIKSDTAHELVTRAMAARSAGDLGQARDLVKSALDFDPSDHAATILLDQYQDELDVDGGGAPRALIEVPIGRARPAQRVELIAKISINGAAPRGAVNNPRFTLKGPGVEKLVVVATQRENGTLVAHFIPPREGNYDVVFEANTEGIPFRAEHLLDVTK